MMVRLFLRTSYTSPKLLLIAIGPSHEMPNGVNHLKPNLSFFPLKLRDSRNSTRCPSTNYLNITFWSTASMFLLIVNVLFILFIPWFGHYCPFRLHRFLERFLGRTLFIFFLHCNLILPLEICFLPFVAIVNSSVVYLLVWI